MSGVGVRFQLFRGEEPDSANGSSLGREAQELWFALARKPWSSLVIVPADEGPSAASVATALAHVGSRLRDLPVTAIVADSMDFESARILADLQRVHPDRREIEATNVEWRRVSNHEPPATEGSPGATPPRPARLLPPAGQVVIAIQPIVVEPLGVAIAQAADAVVLCVHLGKTRLRAARRTMEIVGRERVAGLVVLH